MLGNPSLKCTSIVIQWLESSTQLNAIVKNYYFKKFIRNRGWRLPGYLYFMLIWKRIGHDTWNMPKKTLSWKAKQIVFCSSNAFLWGHIWLNKVVRAVAITGQMVSWYSPWTCFRCQVVFIFCIYLIFYLFIVRY